MKILVITGSPHKAGTSALMAEQFIKGAAEAGHEVCRFDSAFKNIHPCIACERCHNTDKGCTFKDDMEELNPQLLEADAVIFVSPIYYYGMTAQIKSVIDRFYANDAALHGSKKSALLLTFADDTVESAEGSVATFKGMINYLKWEDAGIIAALECSVLEDIKKTDFPKQAYEFGKTFGSN